MIKKIIVSYLDEIAKGGGLILLQKLRTLICIILALPLVLLMRVLRPFLFVRIGHLPSWRIGHFTINTELYLCKRDLGMDIARSLDIFYHDHIISNYQIKKMWDRTLRVWDFAKWVDKLNQFIPGWEAYRVDLKDSMDYTGILPNTKTHLAFLPEEECLGKEFLEKIGMGEDDYFVCFIARTSEYLNFLSSEKNWHYHNYRDSDIRNYLPAAEELTRRGYWAFRLGAAVNGRLITNNNRIIDYAKDFRTDFLDIYLGAKCRFFICDTAGISSVPLIFRRPIAWVNYIPLGLVVTANPQDLFIPKRLWFKRDKRFLNFREILGSQISTYLKSEQYENAGIEVVENTPEDILDLAIEMDERLKGTWQENSEDTELQQAFWNVFPKLPNQVILSRIGAKFLRQNRKLLD